MGDRSKIEWTDAIWNPVSGCSKVSAGCKFCYAERQFPCVYPRRAFTDVRLHPERLEQPLHCKRPRKIFVNSMSDLFHETVPTEFILKVFRVMGEARQHTFQVLTKRPDRMLALCSEFTIQNSSFPNVWLGVSVEDQATADERIPLLLGTPAAVRFISYEPALGPLDCRNSNFEIRQLDWVIAGGESGPQARPSHPDWFRSVLDQCQASCVPFFFKQWGEWFPECLKRPGEHAGLCLDGQNVDACGSSDFVRLKDDIAKPVACMTRVGKKRSGRLLDGRGWNEFPSASQVGGCGR